jgi:pimeloyl-ACP methyl ester carboxylesterase
MKTGVLLLSIVGVALLVLALLYAWQDRLLYFPVRAASHALAVDGLAAWPSAQDLRGLLHAPAGPVRGTVLVFHGNAGHAGHRAFYAQAIAPQGWRVLLAEYPGYGPRTGRPSEASLVADAEATIVQAHRDFGAPLVVVGESLGAGVAAAAAARRPSLLAGLVLITPWDRLARVGALHYPWLPVEAMLRDRYDSAAHLARFDRPVVVAVAEHDALVPARLGRDLHAALPGPKRLVVIPDAGHNDWPERVDGDWWRAVLDFAAGASSAR